MAVGECVVASSQVHAWKMRWELSVNRRRPSDDRRWYVFALEPTSGCEFGRRPCDAARQQPEESSLDVVRCRERNGKKNIDQRQLCSDHGKHERFAFGVHSSMRLELGLWSHNFWDQFIFASNQRKRFPPRALESLIQMASSKTSLTRAFRLCHWTLNSLRFDSVECRRISETFRAAQRKDQRDYHRCFFPGFGWHIERWSLY